MSRKARICKSLPDWILEAMLAWPSWREWWSAAYLEAWNRKVEAEIAAAANAETGPWPVSIPRGMH